MKAEINHIQALLEPGLQQFALQSLKNSLADYLFLLHKWNVAYNLTAIRDLKSMVSKHILDSLAVLPWLKGTHVIDVGTGAGLPGIPLALARPDFNFVLLDSNGKKTRFLQEVKRELKLKNVEIVQFRVENYRPSQGFDTVISRAFSSLQQMIQWTQHLIGQQGIWLAMKGRSPDEELPKIKLRTQVVHYSVAGVEGERCCVIIEK
jgi:16S rRNA (guanine527-N7)-methyltransferase